LRERARLLPPLPSALSVSARGVGGSDGSASSSCSTSSAESTPPPSRGVSLSANDAAGLPGAGTSACALAFSTSRVRRSAGARGTPAVASGRTREPRCRRYRQCFGFRATGLLAWPRYSAQVGDSMVGGLQE
jgi:hypothetical protein